MEVSISKQNSNHLNETLLYKQQQEKIKSFQKQGPLICIYKLAKQLFIIKMQLHLICSTKH